MRAISDDPMPRIAGMARSYGATRIAGMARLYGVFCLDSG
jgi:hypothetical protein